MKAAGTVEDFATLLAELANPFALRRALLAARGLTPEEFHGLHARWVELLRAEPDGMLRTRFSAAYSTMTTALRSAQHREEVGAELLAAADTEELPDAAEVTSRTMELDVAALAEAGVLPFRGAGLVQDDDSEVDEPTLAMAGLRRPTPTPPRPTRVRHVVEELPLLPRPLLPFSRANDDKTKR